MTAADDVPPLGSAAEEAARLAESLRGWFAEATADAGQDHAACTSCPLCLGLTRLRAVSPQVVDHLSVAAGSLVAALREFRTPTSGAGGSGPS